MIGNNVLSCQELLEIKGLNTMKLMAIGPYRATSEKKIEN